jgi:Ni,Fe-hydrogenase I cytochrome b subunit
MLRYKYIITVKDNSEYSKKERVINMLKYTFTILIGVFMIILVLIQYGQHENDEFFKKYYKLLSFVRISIGITKVIIDFTMITVFIITLTFFYKLKSQK